MESHNTRSDNANGVPQIYYLTSPFKSYLRNLKKTAKIVTIPEELFHLPQNKVRAILKGYLVGDGWIEKRKYGYDLNNLYGCGTISMELRDAVCRWHLMLGTPMYSILVKNHQGLGKNPIYRMLCNPKSLFARSYGYDGLSETSIKSVEKMGVGKVMDFQVADTKTFFFKNGVSSHNCDNFALVMNAFLAIAIKKAGLRYQGAFTIAWSRNHAYNLYVDSEKQIWIYEPQTGVTKGLLKEGEDSYDTQKIWFIGDKT